MNATSTMKVKQAMNGVEVQRLFDTIDAVKQMPEAAKFRFRATNRWMDGGHNRSTIRNFYGACEEHTDRKKTFEFDNDEPDVLLGQDNGANPVEYLLHALAGCVTTSFIYHAAARGIRIEALESELEGDIDLHGFLGLSEDKHSGYEQIRVKFRVKSDAPIGELQKLVQYAKFRSPVFSTVTNAVPVEIIMNAMES